MAKRKQRFDNEKAKAADAKWHEFDEFAATTVRVNRRFQRLIRFARNGEVWIHKDFQK